MREWIEKFKNAGLLKIIDKPCDVDLEIAHLSYIEVKKDDSKALLFTNVIDKNGKKYPPVLTNTFSSQKALELIFEKPLEEIANEIASLLKPKKPANFKEKFDFLSYLFSLRKIFTKKIKSQGECQSVKFLGDEVNLFDLPILKTWDKDGGKFITMGQVYTKDLNGETQNLGMYRLQLYSKNTLGMHWQIHKDGANFYNDYKKAGVKMPVSIAIGGDPLYIWSAQAPLPKGIFELLLCGFIRKKPVKLVKSITNNIYIPSDCDYVIEGFVDTNESKLEGPFGDHTGFYTPILPFPIMRVSAITSKNNPIFHATVVGKPPLEDKFMGYATERIFLPLLQTSTPDLIDYRMPENGVFHNLILAKMRVNYPFAAKQMMHAFWGVGQMSFVKHAIFIDESGPDLNDYENFTRYVLNRISSKSILISEGICDQLDHASPNSCFGGKLGIDATIDISEELCEILKDDELLDKFKSADKNIINLKQYFTETKFPITLVNIDKSELIKNSFDKILKFKNNFRCVIFLDENIDLNNPYMLVWRITNNIDAIRDIFINENNIVLDATIKHEWEGFNREWPDEIWCNKDIIENLISKNLIEKNDEFFKKFEILKEKL